MGALGLKLCQHPAEGILSIMFFYFEIVSYLQIGDQNCPIFQKNL